MKKSLLLLGSVAVLAACGSTTTSTTTTTKATSAAATTTTTAKAATTATLKDGTYKAESGYDERGWKVTHSIVVKDGKIAESKFDYTSKEGKLKSQDEAYNTNMKAKSGVSAKEAADKLNAQLVATQDVSKVETVTGATNTSNGFKQATELLLKAAAEGKTDLITFELKH